MYMYMYMYMNLKHRIDELPCTEADHIVECVVERQCFGD